MMDKWHHDQVKIPSRFQKVLKLSQKDRKFKNDKELKIRLDTDLHFKLLIAAAPHRMQGWGGMYTCT